MNLAQDTRSEGIIIESPSLKTANFIGFQIKREDWDMIRLEDKTIIKARIILASVLMEGKLEDEIAKTQTGQKPKLKFTFIPKIEYAVESPQEFRGDRDQRSYTPEQLGSCVVHRDMDFETLKSSWNLYELENGIILKIRYSLIKIDKTSKYDSGGMPIYMINGSADVKVELPEHLRKLLEKKGSAPIENI
jgi:hypothetical protein